MSTHRVTWAGYMAGILHLCRHAKKEGIAPFRGEGEQREILRQIAALVEDLAAPYDPQDEAGCFVFLSEVLADEADRIVGEGTEQWGQVDSVLDYYQARKNVERAFSPEDEEE